MKPNNKAKWIIGITGTAFSAYVLGQLDDTPMDNSHKENIAMATEVYDSMSEREKELVSLDWSNFTLQQGEEKSAYTTRRS